MLITVLETNLGRGYLSYDQFTRAPALYTDAAKESSHTGGGYISECGRYNYWKYGSRVSRLHIDALEGLAILRAAEEIGDTWRGQVVPIYCDNSAFERSLYKGRWLRGLLVPRMHPYVQFPTMPAPALTILTSAAELPFAPGSRLKNI